jgi:hypothetical protein
LGEHKMTTGGELPIGPEQSEGLRLTIGKARVAWVFSSPRQSSICNRRLALPALLLFVMVTGTGRPAASRRSTSLSRFPRLTVWAWENPEDLRTLDAQSRSGAVAYLDQTILISGSVSTRPRMQRLLVSPRTKIMAVVRIEAPVAVADLETPNLPGQVTDLILRSARKPRTSALQIDFDATRSQRGFYTNLLRKVRKGMPADMSLSITAMASWCADDDWIGSLPVDEAVPMFFRMGRDRRPTSAPGWTYPIREPLCQRSAGVATDEPWPAIPPDARVYVFHPGAWNPVDLEKVEAMVKP